MTHSFGAVARGETGATIETGPHGIMLAAVRGTLSTPALESVKAAFAKLGAIDAGAAQVVAAAAPSMIAESVAIVLLRGTQAFVAVTGQGAVLLERAGGTSVVTGTHELAAGDAVIASTEALKRPLFSSRAPAPAAAFRNDTLDGELFGGLDRQGALDVGVAAVRVP
jgi:hypothetical protein